MKWIKLTRIDTDRSIWLDGNKIESIEHETESNDDDNPPSSTITTDSKDIFEVKETPQEIFLKLDSSFD